MIVGFSEKQQKVLRFSFDKTHDAIILDGAIRSGKTSVCSISFFLFAMNNFHLQNFLICGKTVQSAERNVIRPLMMINYLQENFNIKYNETKKIMTISRGKTKNWFYIFGGKDESSFSLVQGITAAGALLDEVALMPQSFVNQVTARCSVDGYKFFFNCNPDNPNHWFYKEWILKHKQKNAVYLRFTMDDNPSLSEKRKNAYRNLYSGVFYARYIDGRWVNAEGSIYRIFSENKEEFIKDKIPEDVIMLTAGLDWGGTKSSTAFVCTAITEGFRTFGTIDCEKIDGTWTSDQINQKFFAFCQRVKDKFGKQIITTRADNAEPTLIRSLEVDCARNYLRTNILPAYKKSVKSRIEFKLRMMNQRRFWILKDCKEMIKAIDDAVWDEKKTIATGVDTRLDDGSYCVDLLDADEYSWEEYIDTFDSVNIAKK